VKVVVKKSFNKDITKINNKKLAQKIKNIINSLEHTKTLDKIQNIKKLKGTQNAYRIRTGDYRLGFFVKGKTIELSTFAHRKDIYKKFP